ncbi:MULTISPECIES: hypothetical protein [unclassified Pseudomonas]|uniref:hypothetical protein n=1 Tax=unclassified Pseudomonas TaxID=196821 RepID=UPI002114FCA8|nr:MULTISPECIES: hypothetical protein [unclassified Pseudomonas]
MPIVPKLPAFDSSLALLREGYAFISNRCERLESDVFALRLMLQDMTYQVPTQDLRIDLARMPMRPASGLILSEVQAVQRTRSSVS